MNDTPTNSTPRRARYEAGVYEAPNPTWHGRHHESLSFGERSADRLRDWMGSWTFIGIFLAVMAIWITLNLVAISWDPYPFILLNLFLSLIAGLQGAILLIAAKRQDAIAAALAQHDLETDVASRAQIEELMAINRRQLELLIAQATPTVRPPDSPVIQPSGSSR